MYKKTIKLYTFYSRQIVRYATSISILLLKKETTMAGEKCSITNPLAGRENNSIWKNPNFNDLASESDSGKSKAECKEIL